MRTPRGTKSRQGKMDWIGLHETGWDWTGWNGMGRVVHSTTRRLVVRRKSCNGSSETKGNSLLTTSSLMESCGAVPIRTFLLSSPQAKPGHQDTA